MSNPPNPDIVAFKRMEFILSFGIHVHDVMWLSERNLPSGLAAVPLLQATYPEYKFVIVDGKRDRYDNTQLIYVERVK